MYLQRCVAKWRRFNMNFVIHNRKHRHETENCEHRNICLLIETLFYSTRKSRKVTNNSIENYLCNAWVSFFLFVQVVFFSSYFAVSLVFFFFHSSNKWQCFRFHCLAHREWMKKKSLSQFNGVCVCVLVLCICFIALCVLFGCAWRRWK